MQDIYGILSNINIKLNKKLSHPYLAKHLRAPLIDEDKLFLFHAMFDEAQIDAEKKENYILTAMLVQIALDTHDEVTTAAAIKQDEFKNRQLTILAGDYFSGLYYSLLSDMKDIYMIRTLATAIKEINEHKIRLYDQSIQDASSFYKSVATVESALFQRVSEHFKLPHWNEIASRFLVYKRFMRQTEGDKHLKLFLNDRFMDAYQCFDNFQDEGYVQAEQPIKAYLGSSPFVQKELLNRLDHIKNEPAYHQKVEEG
ncbi:heptaprenyl diphosphate synthase component 1 [Bacillus sp. 179-C3.3 HS]|uniref:heptaprenyl diphosphate synthase component 1 n=1 Tax=Bacillus sp. 179-C3.3 HS TaxID=3232162 RepID=UPI0039A0BBB8